ncbi:flagellin N-terminal helical domain-containing protein [Agathobacter sp.]|uniref:flagellin N-terminal helical domain-containing protein n=1 Tax=Agathobacter sp. TaxID=2021311 RepID=UPI00280BF7C2|nr:flagellin [Agathobacter sp.]
MVVQHNMQAANANRMLNVTTSAQSKSTEKLSSGYKINRAADDAAGLTISEKMRKQIRGLDQASTNAQDGVSSVQTAEGALTEVHSMLQRMNELATQAANGTNSKDSDRQAIQDEIDQLTTEIDRVSETTKFNETYLLKGDAGTKTINMKAHDAGLKGTLTDNGDGTATFVMDTLNAGDKVSIGGKNYTIGGTSDDLDSAFGTNGLDIDTKHQDISVNGTTYKYYAATVQTKDGKGITAGYYSENPSTLADQTAATATGVDGKVTANLAALKTNAPAGSTITVGTKTVTLMKDDGTKGGTASDGIDDTDTTVISKKKAYELASKELLKANQIGDTKGVAAVANAGAKADGSFTITTGKAEVANSLSFSLHVGADADMTNKIQVNIDAMDSASLGIKGLNVKDDSGNAATYAVDAISDAISKVSSQRSALGAVQNRLEHTINNLDNVVENTTTAESRIRDTDMAEEMVNYSKNNILAQAGQSMLAQANQSNQGVLSLLQ